MLSWIASALTCIPQTAIKTDNKITAIGQLISTNEFAFCAYLMLASKTQMRVCLTHFMRIFWTQYLQPVLYIKHWACFKFKLTLLQLHVQLQFWCSCICPGSQMHRNVEMVSISKSHTKVCLQNQTYMYLK